jgi:tight adherence protein B
LTPVVLTFLATAMGILGVCSFVADLFLRDRSRVLRRVDEEFRERQRESVRRSRLFTDPRQTFAEAEAHEEAGLGFPERLTAMVEQSGLNLTVNGLIMLMAAAGIGFGALAVVIRGNVVIGWLATLVGAGIPFLYVYFKWKKRIEKLLRQLPDAFDLMARAVRAGHTVPQSMQAVADEFEPPIAAEFTYCYEQQNLGLSPEMALRDLARRCGLLEIKILVLALLVQQQTGGNLAQLLDDSAAVVRDRLIIRAKVKALTGEGRLQAIVLLALPFFLFFVILLLQPNYAKQLFHYPILLTGTFASMLLGTLWIRKIVNFDF